MDKKVLIGIGIAVVIAIVATLIYFMPSPIANVTTPVDNTDAMGLVVDIREHPASSVYEDDDGNMIRGLMMTDESFEFMTYGHSAAEIESMREQVDDAEENYERNYVVHADNVDYIIENGQIVGEMPHLGP